MKFNLQNRCSAALQRSLRSPLKLLAGAGMFSLSMVSVAQPMSKEVFLNAASDAPPRVIPKSVTLTAADAPMPLGNAQSKGSAAGNMQAARIAPQSAPARAVVATPAATPAATPTTNAREGRRDAVHFSDWIKDNPGALLGSNKNAVPESEIRALFAGALQQAISQSPLLRQAQAEQLAAAADVREAEGQRWPQVDVGANSRGKSLGGNSSNINNSQAVSVNMTTNLFDWGRTSNTIDSRKQLNSAAQQKYLASVETVASDVSSNLIELEKARRITVVSQQYVDRMSSLVGMLGEIVQIDRGRASELTQAKARLIEAEASRDAAAARARDIQIRLRKLIGDAPIQMPENGDWALSTADLTSLLAGLQNHPTLRQADAQANAAQRQADALRSGEKPQLNWVVSKSTAQDQLGREQGLQTMLTVSWPLFRGGSSSAARDAAALRADAERQRKAQQQLDLEFETRTADQDARTLLARAELYRGLTKETDGVRKAFFEQWYHLGRRTLLDVLIAESDYNNNIVNEITTRFDGYQAIVRGYSGAGQLTRWIAGE